ncbi:MAG: Ig-like domain-containing protein, partial [Methanobrevibacter sp.]|nr:Ig-like domain-containing protein [Methanobrevibacter sp.]
VDSPDITVGDDGVITVTLPDDATGTVTIEINGKKYTAKVHNGKAVFRIPGLKVGSYPIKAWYSGDDKYLPTNTNGEINVNPVKSNGSMHHEGLKRHATGNPIFVLILVFVSIAIIPFRKFRK